MKTLLSITLLICFHLSAKAISLADAIKLKKVKVSITTLDHSNDSVYRATFYGACIKATITNLVSESLTLDLEAGRFLMPDDSDVQRMMVIEATSTSFKPREEKTIGIQASCTQMHNAAPSAVTIFKAGKMAEGNLLKMARFVSAKHYNDIAAQESIWAISDGADPSGIFSDDTAEGNGLKRLVCGLLKIPFPKNRSDPAQTFEGRFRTVHIAFDYTLIRPKTVRVEIYNEKDQLLKSCVDNKLQSAGDYNCNYTFTMPVNNTASVDREVIIKYFLDGKLIANDRHTIPNH